MCVPMCVGVCVLCWVLYASTCVQTCASIHACAHAAAAVCVYMHGDANGDSPKVATRLIGGGASTGAGSTGTCSASGGASDIL